MKALEINLDSSTNKKLTLKLFREVENIASIRQEIIGGRLECCVIKPMLVFNPMQVVIAANKAAVSQNQGSLITRTVYSEILFNLSPTKNVTKSLMTFGADDNHTTILVAVLSNLGDANHCANIFKCIKGEECYLSELDELVDVALVKKTYSVNDIGTEKLLYGIINKIVTKEC